MPTLKTPEPEITSEDLRRAEIVQKGKRAQREINAARIAAQQAWQNWRMHGTYVTKDGAVQQKQQFAATFEEAFKPGIRLPDGTQEEGVRYQRLTGEMHPELKALQEIAEAADRRVLDLQDDLDIFMALVPSVKRRMGVA